jgi:hypothetical protein
MGRWYICGFGATAPPPLVAAAAGAAPGAGLGLGLPDGYTRSAIGAAVERERERTSLPTVEAVVDWWWCLCGPSLPRLWRLYWTRRGRSNKRRGEQGRRGTRPRGVWSDFFVFKKSVVMWVGERGTRAKARPHLMICLIGVLACAGLLILTLQNGTREMINPNRCAGFMWPFLACFSV